MRIHFANLLNFCILQNVWKFSVSLAVSCQSPEIVFFFNRFPLAYFSSVLSRKPKVSSELKTNKENVQMGKTKGCHSKPEPP